MNNTDAAAEPETKVFLPGKLLECLPRTSALPSERLRWNTNEEIASFLISFDRHDEWLSCSLKTRPQNGSIILYNRKKVKYRKDGYCWKKRKDGKTTREDHMKLKVQGIECLYGCYVHSSIVPTFHRRCYWLLQNPDIVLVHYLNVPSLEESVKSSSVSCSLGDRRETLRWNRDELLAQLKPMFHSMKWSCVGNSGVDLSVEQMVQQILQTQHVKPQPRTHACLCASPGSNIPHRCNSTKHRIISPKLPIPGPAHPENPPNESSAEVGTGDGVTASDRKQSPGMLDEPLQTEETTGGVGSPCSASSSSLSPQQATTIAISNGYQRSGLATVALPQNALIVMTAAAAPIGCGEEPNGEHGSTHLSITRSGGRLVLSPVPPKQDVPTLTSPVSQCSQGVPTVSLTLLSSPQIGGLQLTERIIKENLGTHLHPSPSSSVLPFDPDSFLNSPKQGQTYGGPTLVALSGSASSSPSPPPSTSPQPPSLSLSPTSPPSSLSSFSSEAERKTNPAHSSSSPSLSFFPSQTKPSFACLESPVGLESFSPSLSAPPAPQTPPGLQAPPVGEPYSFQAQTSSGLHGSLDQFRSQAPLTVEVPSSVSEDQPPQTQASPSIINIQDPPTLQQAPPTSHLAQALPIFQDPPVGLEHQAPQNFVASPNGLETQPMSQAPCTRLETTQDSLDFQAPLIHFEARGLSTNQPPPSQLTDPSIRILSDNQQSRQGEKEELIHIESCLLESNSMCIELHNLAPPLANCTAESPVEVKEELSPHTHLESEVTPMDTSHSTGIDEEEVGLTFDSAFPELISELMTEETVNQTQTPPPLYPIRYMAAPQPVQACSFLPLPLPSNSQSLAPDDTQCLASITDFSPEWSYPEGGVKVLITGPWSETDGRYWCVFDQSRVAASLVQPGVIRCYCPAHEAGAVSLHVLKESALVSSSVLFEYRARNTPPHTPSSQLDWLSLDDNQFRMSILERLEQMERRMAEMSSSSSAQGQHQTRSQSFNPRLTPENQSALWFERRIVAVCERMMAGSRWDSETSPHPPTHTLTHSSRHRGMTLLHLAAAQGYTHLIHTLIRWRSVSVNSLDLELEVDPLNVDHFSCTPLMWACALGRLSSAVLLYHWSSAALLIPDSLGRLPLAVARSRGHTRLARCLEELSSHAAAQEHTPERASPSPLSSSPDTGLSSSSSVPSPSDPPSPSPSSAYSSGSIPDPMDSASSPSSPFSAPPPAGSLDSIFSVNSASSPPSPFSSSPNVNPPSPFQALAADGSSFSRGSPSFTVPSQAEFTNPLFPVNSAPPPADSLFPRDPASPFQAPPPADSLFFMDCDAVSPPPPDDLSLADELLNYSENAENEDYLSTEDLQVDMATLAEQIIEATPERIKQQDFIREAEPPLRERRENPAIRDTMPWLATYLENADRSLCPTPPSLLSDISLQRLRPPSAGWVEFLSASANQRIERDFALLTLTDSEQRELYEAARIIQNAFRRYKGRRLKEQQDLAAAVIQRCYRKYKQYALYKKMTQAAILIQSKFRSYYEQKKFQQSRRAAVLIQQYYRSYKEYERVKGSFLTKRQDQAARKIMRFLRRCRHRIKELKQSKELEHRGLTT
ncbi:hypothetical protein DNTS_014305 [Danionella cerebrum]|uniref:Calmodulin-binding transcription activator 2 n=1 Tax=Danionella cerebrum TaxID=2873325 RepID=A0A553N4D4_9TELE|nr:hypothetical protein DNTS_014305 [Danionella translucida]